MHNDQISLAHLLLNNNLFSKRWICENIFDVPDCFIPDGIEEIGDAEKSPAQSLSLIDQFTEEFIECFTKETENICTRHVSVKVDIDNLKLNPRIQLVPSDAFVCEDRYDLNNYETIVLKMIRFYVVCPMDCNFDTTPYSSPSNLARKLTTAISNSVIRKTGYEDIIATRIPPSYGNGEYKVITTPNGFSFAHRLVGDHRVFEVEIGREYKSSLDYKPLYRSVE